MDNNWREIGEINIGNFRRNLKMDMNDWIFQIWNSGNIGEFRK